MNNFNDSGPDSRGTEAGAGDGRPWNYALVFQMLGLAAFGSIWTWYSQKEIQKGKAQYDQDVNTMKSELEARYREMLKERSRTAAMLKLELDKEKQKVERYKQALEGEDDWYRRATGTLKYLEGQLMQRQHIYCSYTHLRDQRLEIQRNMLKAVREPLGRELGLESDLRDIFNRDTHCADLTNTDLKKNGSLMWVYLKYWQLQIDMQKRKRAEQKIATIST
uniref:Coiled-coil domain containing 127a n=1 Tax=Salarias fasciatus TaxID=181472 RepID=A0A672FNK0_SALFA